MQKYYHKSNLSGNDFKVLMKLLSVLDYENLIQVSQADIARELDMHRQHVQRSIKRLLELGIVLEGCEDRHKPLLQTKPQLWLERLSQRPQRSIS